MAKPNILFYFYRNGDDESLVAYSLTAHYSNPSKDVDLRWSMINRDLYYVESYQSYYPERPDEYPDYITVTIYSPFQRPYSRYKTNWTVVSEGIAGVSSSNTTRNVNDNYSVIISNSEILHTWGNGTGSKAIIVSAELLGQINFDFTEDPDGAGSASIIHSQIAPSYQNGIYYYDSNQTITLKATTLNALFAFDRWSIVSGGTGMAIQSQTSAETSVSNINAPTGGVVQIESLYRHMPVFVYFSLTAPEDSEAEIGIEGNMLTIAQLSDGNKNPMLVDWGTDETVVVSCKTNDSIYKSVDNGYHVSKWVGTNLADSESEATVVYQQLPLSVTIDTTSAGGAQINVSATVILNGQPQTSILTVTSGLGGKVEPPTGEFITYPTQEVAILTPKPATYYSFYKWEYDTTDSNFYELNNSSHQLQVTMNSAKTVNAVFRQQTTEEINLQSVKTYYCPSIAATSNVILYTYTNDTASSQILHFRATFYNSSIKENIVFSSFSLFDQKRWFVKTQTSLIPLTLNGVEIASGESVDIQFVPDVFPIENIEKQNKNTINEMGFTEQSLLCGIQYYMELESYNTNSEFVSLSSSQILVKCSNTNINSWRENKDKDNWYCSGSGKQDLMISNTGAQSIYPSIVSNIYDKFIIAWQSRRESSNPIYTAIWDSEKDVVYGGGQGLPERKALSNGRNVNILIDQAQNPYISTYSSGVILSNRCAFPKIKPYIPQYSIFDDSCYPGYASIVSADLRDIKIRVYQPDVSGSLVINENKVVSSVEKQNIRLDIAGIPGAYAVALRNETDSDWQEWININGELYDTTTHSLLEQNVASEAYLIDSDRFIVPFTMPRVNGIRRICCQVLTFYGITKTICLDVFVNLSLIEYDISFYTDENMENLFSIYNGHPVISSNNLHVYIKVTFNESQSGILKYNVIQQGMSNQYGLPLEVIENTNDMVFKGDFLIKKNDGLFNKDGIAFISIVFPDDPTNIATNCVSDDSDKYNLMLTDNDISKYKTDFETNAYKYYETSRTLKVLEANQFLQYYNKDDSKYIFGNPKFYINE